MWVNNSLTIQINIWLSNYKYNYKLNPTCITDFTN